jgi:hypothetical protein
LAKRNFPSRGSKPDKLCRDALALALNREAIDADGKPTKRLNIIADQLVKKAMGGDLIAIREIFDRIDGKVVQTPAAEAGAPLIIVHSNIIRDGDGTFPLIEAEPLPEDTGKLIERDETVVVPLRP